MACRVGVSAVRKRGNHLQPQLRARAGAPDTKVVVMIILGIILLIAGFVLKISILWTIGIILLVIGVALAIMGSMGHAVAGRRHYF